MKTLSPLKSAPPKACFHLPTGGNETAYPPSIRTLHNTVRWIVLAQANMEPQKHPNTLAPFFTDYNGMSSFSSSEIARRSAPIPKVFNIDYEPPQEPNQSSDSMRAYFAKATIKLLTEAAENDVKYLPEGCYRSHAIWLTSSLPLGIESKMVSHPDEMDEAIASFERESGHEFTLMSRKSKLLSTFVRSSSVLISSKHGQVSFHTRLTRRMCCGLKGGSRIEGHALHQSTGDAMFC